ncbi:MAG: DUF1015 domain-containing protein [Candidatus Omnitrophota bacterium]|nr:DUF1015 domain-containing protein [Candidatus Omnitrophota bacterium]
MAEIRSFKGILYESSRIGGDYSSVVAPPYDVIPGDMRDSLYEKSPHNVIRLILGKDFEGDDQGNNKYTRAGKFLDQWQKEGVLRRDAKDSFYIYLQEYEHNGKICSRVGFLGLIKIEDPGKDTILPHEHTLAKPKEDRLNLIKQVKGNLSPIFTLFDDKDGAVEGILRKGMSLSSPAIDIKQNGEVNRLWRLSDEGSIKSIVRAMKEKKIFIADGHHRYEVSRLYRDIMRSGEGYNGEADYVLMYFGGMEESNNLTVMATHRAIKVLPSGDKDAVERKLSEYFDMTECGDLSGLMDMLERSAAEQYYFGFFDGRKYLFMKPLDGKKLLELIKSNKSEEWKRLDVSVLHSAVLDGILAVKDREGNITYTRGPEEAEALVKDGSHMAAFFLNPTRVEQLKTVAEHGEMMPQKSTYFYPKLLSGLVINTFGG